MHVAWVKPTLVPLLTRHVHTGQDVHSLQCGHDVEGRVRERCDLSSLLAIFNGSLFFLFAAVAYVKCSLIRQQWFVRMQLQAAKDNRIEQLSSEKERLDYERDVLYPLAGLDPDTAAAYWAVQIAKQALSGARMTIAQQYLDGAISREESIALNQKYQLVSAERAAQMTDFNEQYRSYVINYGLGQDMVQAYVETAGPDAKARWAAMERVISEPTLPVDLTFK